MDYFYGHEANQFTFFRIPKLLFSDERFIGLSSDAKILYGLMLDRMGLSVKNGWIDEKNHVYIYFTLEEVMEYMRIGKDKGVKLFAELDDEKGCGLIKKKKQGLGKPTLIYVMNFVSNIECPEDDDYDPSNNDENEASESTEVKTSINAEVKTSTNAEVKTSTNAEVKTSGNAEVKTSEKPKSGLPKIQNSALLENRSPNFAKTEVNNNDFNNNKNNNTDFSEIHPILSYQHGVTPRKKDVMDEIREREKYRELICENIEYEFLAKNYGESEATGVVNIMLDAICSKKDYLVIKSEQIPQMVVKSVLLKLDYSHVEYVLDCMKKNLTKVHNIDSYLLTSLYNSISTIDHYYRAEVNHDMYGNI